MKSILSTNPTFTPGAANTGTLNFSSVNGFNIAGLLAVLNQTRGTLLYATGQASTSYFSWNSGTKVLTLKVDTSTHSSGDQLQVIYDSPSSAESNDTLLVHRAFTTASTNATVVTASPAYIKSVYLQRNFVGASSTNTFLKVYNKSTTPNPAVDTPILTHYQYTDYENSAYILPAPGILNSNGIGYVATKGIADTNTTATVANEAIITILYTLA
jgi:hypothetical protein